MKSILVLYHKDCFDGFGAAWAAYKKFGKKADYRGVEHQMPAPDLKNKEIYLLDFCYQNKETMKELLENNKKVVVIEHHISQKEFVKISSEYVYDISHSGAVLAWRYFHPQKPAPRLLRYIEDIDLWRFKLPYTRELMAVLDIYNFNFLPWSRLAHDFEKAGTRKKHLKEGKAILRHQNKIIERLAGRANKVFFEGYKALAVNSPILMSEIGHRLAERKDADGVAIIWSQKNNKKHVSLRSNGKIDVSELAKKYGGGGHKAAAGFVLNVNEPFPWEND